MTDPGRPQSAGSARERAPLPAGSSAFDLPLGPIRARVLDLPTTWDFVAEHYDPFCAAPDGQPVDLTVTCRYEPGVVVVPLPPPGGSTVLKLDHVGGRRFRIASHWQDGWFDLETGRGEIVLVDRGYTAVRMSIENFLRVAGQLCLVSHDAFLMHTAGILDRGRVFLFFGPSGVGKSTATEFSAPRRGLSDDMVLLELRGDQAVAHAVPFFGKFPAHERVRGVFPIAAALRLRQSPVDRLERLTPARAVATVSGSVPFIHELGLPHEGLTDLVSRFCARVPAFDLHFTRSANFWTLLDEAFPA
jgi:hypothetical protein